MGDSIKDISLLDEETLVRVLKSIKWAAQDMGMGPSRCALHSMRAGGAKTLASNGVEIDIIRRFGRR